MPTYSVGDYIVDLFNKVRQDPRTQSTTKGRSLGAAAAEVVRRQDPLYTATQSNGPDLNDPVVRQILADVEKAGGEQAYQEQIRSGSSAAGTDLGAPPPGESRLERMFNASQSSVIPLEYQNLPMAREADAALRALGVANEAIRGTPLEGVATAFPLGGIEAGMSLTRGLPRGSTPKLGTIVRDRLSKPAAPAEPTVRFAGIRGEDSFGDAYTPYQKLDAEGNVVETGALYHDGPAVRDTPEGAQTLTPTESGKIRQAFKERPSTPDNTPTPRTPEEIAADQAELNAMFDKALADGDITPDELTALNRQFDNEQPLGRQEQLVRTDPQTGKEITQDVTTYTNDEIGRVLEQRQAAQTAPRIVDTAPPEVLGAPGNDNFPETLWKGVEDQNNVQIPPRSTTGDGGSGGQPPTGNTPPTGGGSTPPPRPPVDIEALKTRLVDSLRQASTLSKERKSALSKERSERIKRAMQARQASPGGEEGHRAALAALKGEMDLPGDLESIRDKFGPEEVGALFNHIVTGPESLTPYAQIKTGVALDKLLRGRVPSGLELHLLKRVFGQELVDGVMAHRTTLARWGHAFAETINLPRALMATLDLSAPLRQGLPLITSPEYWKAFGSMFRQAGSKGFFEATQEAFRAHPNYELMEKSGLYLAEHFDDISLREEQFMSNLPNRIPGFKHAYGFSERGYTGFLNKLRFDTFNKLVELQRKAGVDLDANPEIAKSMANFVNTATGRGHLGKLSQAAPYLNGLFFSPRLMSSRLSLLNPMTYARLDPVTRVYAIKSMVGMGATAVLVASLLKMNGYSVETDPRSSDFMKPRDGNTRYDILGGFGQYITLGARLATNETKTLAGEVQEIGKAFGSNDRLDVFLRFLQGKESPIASFITDYLRGENLIGEKFEVTSALTSRITPLVIQDLYDAFKEEGTTGVLKASPAIFGVGVQTFEPTRSEIRMSEGADEASDPTMAEFQRLNRVNGKAILPSISKGDLRNFEADDADLSLYRELAEKYTYDYVKQLQDVGVWDQLSDPEKIEELRGIAKDMRANAREDLFPDFYGKSQPPEEPDAEE